MKKIFGIAILAATILFAQITYCEAKMSRNEMYLGGLTNGSSVAEMKKIYGTPTEDGMGFEENRMCRYGDSVFIKYNTLEEKIQSILVRNNNGWHSPSGFRVGGNIRIVQNFCGSPEYSISNENKTVYIYFYGGRKKYEPELGFSVLFDNTNGQILQLGVHGDTTEEKFYKYYEEMAEQMVA